LLGQKISVQNGPENIRIYWANYSHLNMGHPVLKWYGPENIIFEGRKISFRGHTYEYLLIGIK